MTVIDQMLEKYPVHTDGDLQHALREIMQEVALAGLYRAGFFDKAAFYGDTCLRIFYGLSRFSEDLDFSLLQPNKHFSLTPYFQALTAEFSALGFDIELQERKKAIDSQVVSAFLKKNTSIYDLQITGGKTLKIKFEVDTAPPPGFATEEKLLLQPYSFYVKCFALPDLYAGKVHALLFRRWKNRVKGRDWFDFEWYVRQGAPLNLAHLCERARQSGDWQEPTMTPRQFKDLLHARIRTLSVDSARNDIKPFIKDAQQLAIWSPDYFMQLGEMVKFYEGG